MDIRQYVKKEVAELSAYGIDDARVRVKLDAMENPYPLPMGVKKELAGALASVEVNRYPDPGAKRLKASLAGYIGTAPERLVLGNGSDELIGMIISVFGGSPGTVAYPVPTFAMYNIIARSQGQKVLELPLTENFELDFDGCLRVIMDKRPDVLFVANPNNPTGNLFDPDKLRRLVSGFSGIAVVDEAYHSFSGESVLALLDECPNLIILRTLSKVGMAGLRVGAMVASREVVAEVEKVRLPYNLNGYSQKAAEVLLKHREVIDCQVELIVKERGKLAAGLGAVEGVTVFPSSANFIMFRTDGASKIYEALKDRGILIKNLDRPGPLAGCLRVTVGTPEENAEFLENFKELAG